MKKPIYEKADNNTLRITQEQVDNITLNQLLQNKKLMLDQKKRLLDEKEKGLTQIAMAVAVIDKRVADIDTVLAEAKKLGIVVKEEPKKPTVKGKSTDIKLGEK